jgi:hypothetical protein
MTQAMNVAQQICNVLVAEARNFGALQLSNLHVFGYLDVKSRVLELLYIVSHKIKVPHLL